MALPASSPATWLTALVVVASLAWALYRLALPKPLAGIPYVHSSAGSILGNIPDLLSYQKRTGGNIVTYLTATVESLHAPLVQIFLKPLGRPVLVLADYTEAQALLQHRREFDRAPALKALLAGILPEHHLHLPTGPQWRSQRRLVSELMATASLADIAAPRVYAAVSRTLELWALKARLANGSSWSAAADARFMALSAIASFMLGDEAAHDATTPSLERVKLLNPTARPNEASTAGNEAHFPQGPLPPFLKAVEVLGASVEQLHGALSPRLTWARVKLAPSFRAADRVKEAHITARIRAAVSKLAVSDKEGSEVDAAAVEQVIRREAQFAERDGRPAVFESRMLKDEIFGLIFAGFETTGTGISWALKLISDSAATQARLRAAFATSFPARDRRPSAAEIVAARIPYLDATIEEIIRCGHTTPFVDRAALDDTVLLGHVVPKGTTVLCLPKGPSISGPAFAVDEGARFRRPAAGAVETRDRAGAEGSTWDDSTLERFAPERWLTRDTLHNTRDREKVGEQGGEHDTQDKESEGERFSPQSAPMLGFGLGARACFGQRFVRLELKIMLVLLLWEFELRPTRGEKGGSGFPLQPPGDPSCGYLNLQARGRGV